MISEGQGKALVGLRLCSAGRVGSFTPSLLDTAGFRVSGLSHRQLRIPQLLVEGGSLFLRCVLVAWGGAGPTQFPEPSVCQVEEVTRVPESDLCCDNLLGSVMALRGAPHTLCSQVLFPLEYGAHVHDG